MSIRNGSTALEGTTITWGEVERDQPETLCCPLIDNNGTGALNLPVDSCRWRAELPEHRSCYGAVPKQLPDGTWQVIGCRGKRPKLHVVTAEAENKMAAKRTAKTKQATARAAQIVAMHHSGKTVDEIRMELGCVKETVYRRLREAGIYSRENSNLKNRVYQWLDNNPTATKKQVSELKKTISRMQHALKKQSHDDFFEADLTFHEKIVFFHGNETLGQLMNQLNDKIQRIRYLTTYIDKRLEETIGEHQDVVSAIEENNPEKAEQKLAYHLTKVKDGLAALFEKQGPQFLGGYFYKE